MAALKRGQFGILPIEFRLCFCNLLIEKLRGLFCLLLATSRTLLEEHRGDGRTDVLSGSRIVHRDIDVEAGRVSGFRIIRGTNGGYLDGGSQLRGKNPDRYMI